MSHSLFNGFEPVSAKQWKQKIQADLKGDSYDQVITPTPEGIDITPFYHPDQHIKTHSIDTPTKWLISEELQQLASAENNVDPSATGTQHYSLTYAKNSSALLAALEKLPASFPLHITAEADPQPLHQELKTLQHDHLRIGFDPIAQLAYTGNWFNNQTKDFTSLHAHLEQKNAVLSIDIRGYHEAGATITQQLAYLLAHTNEYFNALDQRNKGLSSINVNIKTAIGGNYFFEIAKHKAIRVLLHTLSQAYDYNIDLKLIAAPGKRNKTLYDYNTNMLRTTTECMSAVLGGADIVSNLPYDQIYHHPNEFADRIARNQLLILKHESYFDVVKNPAEGAYYIESLTNQLAEKALDIFKQIEQGGGFLNQLSEGIIQRKIKEQAAKEQQAFDAKENVLVGTNIFENNEDQMHQTLEKHPFLTAQSRKTLIEPIIQRRLAEKVEQERLTAEQSLNA